MIRLEFTPDFSRFTDYKLLTLPHSLLGCRAWDQLVQVLTDVGYIEAMCAKGLLAELLDIYRESMAALPALQEGELRRRQQEECIVGYVEGLTAQAKQVTTATGAPVGEGKAEARNERPLPPPRAIAPDNEQDLEARTASIIASPNPADVLSAFAEFLDSESYALRSCGARPEFCVQQALKSPIGGPVNRAARRRLTSIPSSSPLVREHEATQPGLVPHRALRRTAQVPGAAIRAVATSALGHRAVTGGDDGKLRLWDVDSGTQEIMASTGEMRTFCLAMSPDGDRIVSGDDQGNMAVWDVRSQALLWRTRAHDGYLTGIAISADGRRALTGGMDRLVRSWDLAGECCLGTLSQKDQGEVVSVAMTADGRLGISGHSVGPRFEGVAYSLNVWDIEKHIIARNLFAPLGRGCVAVTPDGKVIVCGDSSGRIMAWEGDSPKPVQEIETHAGGVKSLAITADGRFIVSLGDGGHLGLWDWRAAKCVRSVRGHFTGGAVAASVDASIVISTGSPGGEQLRIWDLCRGIEPKRVGRHPGPVSSVRLVAKHDRVIAAGGDRLSGWHLDEGHPIDDCEHPEGLQVGFNFSFSSGCSVAVGLDNQLQPHLWRVGSDVMPRRFGDNHPAQACTITADGRHVLLSRFDGDVQLWDTEFQELVGKPFSQRSPASRLTLLADGRSILTQGDDRMLRAWDLVTGASTMALLLSEQESCPVIMPDERLALIQSRCNSMRVIDIGLGMWRGAVAADKEVFENCLPTPDGRRLLSYGCNLSCEDVYVWDLRTLRRIGTLHVGAFAYATMSGDGRLLITNDVQGIVRIWSLENGDCRGVFYESRGARSVSNLLPDGRFAVGCTSGDVALMKLRNIEQETPFVTAVVRWRLGAAERAAGWDSSATGVCPWCEHDFVVPGNVTSAITGIQKSAALPYEAVPCVDLPDMAWDDARLYSECSECQRPIRFNPFMVNRRDGFVARGGGHSRCENRTVIAASERRSVNKRALCCECRAEVSQPRAMLSDHRVLCRSCVVDLVDKPPSLWRNREGAKRRCDVCGKQDWDHALEAKCGTVCLLCLEAMMESESHAESLDARSPEAVTDALTPKASYSNRLTVLWRCKDAYARVATEDDDHRSRFLAALAANVGFVEAHPLCRTGRILAIEACVAIGADVLPALNDQRRADPWQMRANTALAAGRIDLSDDRVRTIVKEAAEDSTAEVREFVPQALFNCDAEWSRKIAEDLLDDSARIVRDAALWLLDTWDIAAGKMTLKDKEMRLFIQQLLDADGSPQLRARLPLSLYNQRGTWARKLAEKLARDEDATVRSEAQKLLRGWENGIDPWSQ